MYARLLKPKITPCVCCEGLARLGREGSRSVADVECLYMVHWVRHKAGEDLVCWGSVCEAP